MSVFASECVYVTAWSLYMLMMFTCLPTPSLFGHACLSPVLVRYILMDALEQIFAGGGS